MLKKEQEKRKYQRYGIASIAIIYILSTGESIEAFISSISQGGIGIYSQHIIDIGLDIDVQISFLQTNGNEEITETIPGQVVWVKNLQKNFVIGITFTTLDSVRHANLLNYIEAASQGMA